MFAITKMAATATKLERNIVKNAAKLPAGAKTFINDSKATGQAILGGEV